MSTLSTKESMESRCQLLGQCNYCKRYLEELCYDWLEIRYVAGRAEYIGQMLKVHQYMQACANPVAEKAAYAAVVGPKDRVDAMKRDNLKSEETFL